jgi:hypothetical protein
MYRVIELFGENEPWWFFDDWENDIVSSIEFSSFQEAVNHYKNAWQKLHTTFPEIDSKDNFLAAFWDEKEEEWCEECGDYLQLFHGLALLKDNQAIENIEQCLKSLSKMPKMKTCALKRA